MSPTQAPPPAYKPADPSQRLPKNMVRRWKSTFCLSFLFIALLVAPWVLTCILEKRPIGGHIQSWSLINGTLGEDTVSEAEGWYRALEGLRTVTAVVTIPAISLVLSHAAVVLLQRQHPKQRLNALEMLDLADAPWSRLSPGSGAPRFVYAAVALILFGMLQLVIQASLVVPEYIQVATWLDVPDARHPDHSLDLLRYQTLGYDPEPGALAVVPLNLVVNDVAARMAVESPEGVQPYLWLDRGASDPKGVKLTRDFIQSSFYWYITPPTYVGLEFFTSALPAGTNTGVLRYLATRLNSSVTCESVPSSTFPDSCPGNRPFIGNTIIQDNGTDAAQFRWCVPGDYTSSPWLLTRNRQEILEDMYLQVNVPDQSTYKEFYDKSQSFTIHCASQTTRGSFELPSYHNQYYPGPLLENWPEPNEIYSNFNDRIDYRAPTNNDTYVTDDLFWSYRSPDPYFTSSQITPGPLTVAMISMLGNSSWFHPLQNKTTLSDEVLAGATHLSICSHGAPFLSWGNTLSADIFSWSAFGSCFFLDNSLQRSSSVTPSEGLGHFAFEWFQAFNNTANINQILSAGMFFANEATLTRAAGEDSQTYKGEVRAISYSAGRSLVKPSISQPAKIVVSVLIGIEVISLIGLLVFIYLTPTFTKRIDAATTAVLGAHLFSSGISIPHLGLMNRKTLKSLEEKDGLIGVNGGFDKISDSSIGGGREQANHNGAHDQSSLLNEIEMGNLNHPQQAVDMLEVPAGSLVLGGRGLVTGQVIHSK